MAVLLEAGEYRLMARARSTEPAEANRAVLRVSSGRSLVLPVELTPEWARLTHDFSVAEQGYVELVCDFSGVGGVRLVFQWFRLRSTTGAMTRERLALIVLGSPALRAARMDLIEALRHE